MLIHLFEKIMDKYAASEKKPRYYGTDQLLYRSEVHTIDAIGKNNNINVTNLSTYLGVTKGAVSQMIEKLIKKDMLVKTIVSPSDTEVALSLTLKGEQAFEGHRKYHHDFYEQIEQTIATISNEDIQTFLNILNKFEEFLSNKI